MQASTASDSELRAAARGQAGRLRGSAYWFAMALGAAGLLMAINQTFSLRLLGFDPLGNSFLYYLIGIYLAASYLVYPFGKKQKDHVPWFDWVLGAAAIGSTTYLALHGLTIIEQGWDFNAPTEATLTSALLLLLILEGVRRCGGVPASLSFQRGMTAVAPLYMSKVSSMAFMYA